MFCVYVRSENISKYFKLKTDINWFATDHSPLWNIFGIYLFTIENFYIFSRSTGKQNRPNGRRENSRPGVEGGVRINSSAIILDYMQLMVFNGASDARFY